MWSPKLVSKLGLALFLPLNVLTTNAIAQVKVYDVNAIHELYSENELAAKKLHQTKMQSYTDESIRSTTII